MGDSLGLTSSLSLLPATLAIGGSIFLWLIRWPALAIGFLLISLVAGQVIRLPLPGQGGGVLLSDVATVVTILAAGAHLLAHRKIPLFIAILFGFIGMFLCWSAYPLVFASTSLKSGEIIIALAYWARLASILLLILALLILRSQPYMNVLLRRGLHITVYAIVILGFTQLFFMPNISALTKYGWDPHESRLVSTWLDPNFIGVFLIMLVPVVISRVRKIPLSWIGVGAILFALITTQSRSSWIAALALLTLFPCVLIVLKNHVSSLTIKWLVGNGVVISALGIMIVVGMFPHRISGLVTADDTVQLRANALQEGWYRVIEPNSVIGTGYNAYQFYARDAGLISNFSIHSRAGLDNSFFTLWATTGLIGLALLVSLGTWIVGLLWKKWQQGREVYPLLGLAAIGALVIHALFVNSLLYAHLGITLALVIALSWHSLSPTLNPRSHVWSK